MPSNDARWIIGTIVVLGGVLSAQIAAQFGGVNARLDRIETGIRGLDAKLRAIEVTLANGPVPHNPGTPPPTHTNAW